MVKEFIVLEFNIFTTNTEGKMSRIGCKDTEKDQRLLCIAKGYGKTAVRRLISDEYEKSPPAWSTIPELFQEYQSRESCSHGEKR